MVLGSGHQQCLGQDGVKMDRTCGVKRKGGHLGNLLGWKSTARSKELPRKSDSQPHCTTGESIEI